jgi:hypothetical protein
LIEKLEDKLRKLGNIIGDVLSMIEQEAINATIDPFTKRKIMELIDIYAEEFDETLKKHRVSMFKEVKTYMIRLQNDLERIINGDISANAKLKKPNIIQTY